VLFLGMDGLDHMIQIYCGDKAGKVCNINVLQQLSLFSVPFSQSRSLSVMISESTSSPC